VAALEAEPKKVPLVVARLTMSRNGCCKRAGDFLRVQGHIHAFSLRPADARREARDLKHLLGLGQRISPVEVNYRVG
jgi:hypothetical protein